MIHKKLREKNKEAICEKQSGMSPELHPII